MQLLKFLKEDHVCARRGIYCGGTSSKYFRFQQPSTASNGLTEFSPKQKRPKTEPTWFPTQPVWTKPSRVPSSTGSWSSFQFWDALKWSSRFWSDESAFGGLERRVRRSGCKSGCPTFSIWNVSSNADRSIGVSSQGLTSSDIEVSGAPNSKMTIGTIVRNDEGRK